MKILFDPYIIHHQHGHLTLPERSLIKFGSFVKSFPSVLPFLSRLFDTECFENP